MSVRARLEGPPQGRAGATARTRRGGGRGSFLGLGLRSAQSAPKDGAGLHSVRGQGGPFMRLRGGEFSTGIDTRSKEHPLWIVKCPGVKSKNWCPRNGILRKLSSRLTPRRTIPTRPCSAQVKTLGENPSRRYGVCWIDLPTRLLEPLLENEPISNGRWNRQEARKRKWLDTSAYGAS